MFDPDAKRIPDPLYTLGLYLRTHHENLIDDDLDFLVKNFATHFKKLFYSTCLLSKLQSDAEFLKKYDQTLAISVQNIEYCFYKISTIWEMAFEIVGKIHSLGISKKHRIPYVMERFTHYKKPFNLNWYEEINEIRNRITHGGFRIMPFHVDDDSGAPRICFQAYTPSYTERTSQNPYYTNTGNNGINYADNYFAYYTHMLYTFLSHFFSITLQDMAQKFDHDINQLQEADEILLFDSLVLERKTWLLSDTRVFQLITDKMIYLQMNEGRTQNFDLCSKSLIEAHYNTPPFTLMKEIASAEPFAQPYEE